MKKLLLSLMSLICLLFLVNASEYTIWKASKVESKPAKVILVSTEDYRKMITGEDSYIEVDSVYWVEYKNHTYVLTGLNGIPKVIPASKYLISEIKIYK